MNNNGSSLSIFDNEVDRIAINLKPGDVIFGDETVWGVMLADVTAAGQNVMVMTDKDTTRLLATERV